MITPREDGGSAIIEFIFVAVIVMVPLVYLVVAVAAVQRSELAVTQAAREAGRAYATSDTPAEAIGRAQVAVRIALQDQGLPDDVDVSYVAAGAPCTADPIEPTLAAGEQFTICVTRRLTVPAVPRVLAGRGITTVGRFVVHVDDYRASS